MRHGKDSLQAFQKPKVHEEFFDDEKLNFELYAEFNQIFRLRFKISKANQKFLQNLRSSPNLT